MHPLLRMQAQRSHGPGSTSGHAPLAIRAHRNTILAAEGDAAPAAECECGAGTKVVYTLLGAALGFAGGWALSDAKKADLKSRARAGAASAADRAAARLRR